MSYANILNIAQITKFIPNYLISAPNQLSFHENSSVIVKYFRQIFVYLRINANLNATYI